MALPAPQLDDRRFQDFVDDAKRLVQRRCPEWTDHNVSDPGVTLIEAFAMMADQLSFRLNRVPDAVYLRFLDLLGIQLFPATAARVPVTFWLSAPQQEQVRIPSGTVVATRRSSGEQVRSFSTVADLFIVATSLQEVRSATDEGGLVDHGPDLGVGRVITCFSPRPAVGEALLLGLADAAPSCAVAIRLDCAVDGIGVDPRQPPLSWEAWGGDGWLRCLVERDETGGLNRAGDVVLHLPASHQTSVLGGVRAGWLRARVVEPAQGRPAYSASPTIRRVTAFVVGGTTDAVNAEEVAGEVLGTSDGVAGQRFSVARTPVLATESGVVLEVTAPDTTDGWQPWQQVDDFADSGADDCHFVLHPSTGEVELGPVVRLEDGEIRQYGAAPPRGAVLRLRGYRTGGGAGGNVSPHTLTVLRSSIPYVSRVDNRLPARGGRDGEDLDNAKLRGALQLRSRGRAVTAEDYEHLARQAAPEMARIRCVAADGVIRVQVVPSLGTVGERVPFDLLIPSEDSLRRIVSVLDERRVLGTSVVVEPPSYRGLTVAARLRARKGGDPAVVQAEALRALYRYYAAVGGGPNGTGWPFGRPVRFGETFAVLQAVPGVDLVEDVRLFAADPVTGERGQAEECIDVAPNALVFSYDHQVKVTACAD